MSLPVGLLLLLLPLVSAQSFQWGPCPSPSVQSNFTLQQYLGRWYEIEKLHPFMYQSGKCIEANFVAKSDGGARVRFTQTVNNKVETMEGVVDQDIEEPAKLGISYHYLFPKKYWWVLATDYSTVAAVYYCHDFLQLFHMDFAWITGRTRSLPPDVVQEAKKVFLTNKIDISNMIAADQTGCEDE
uniref:apolipoprotein D-like n=1 Tax=Centroberyx gerrardi TaxID=166262 RepID=UPI003AAC0CB3